MRDFRHLLWELEKSVVLIAGGGYGIGLAIAESFLGASVAEIILAGRTASRLRQAVDVLSKSGGTKVSYRVVDITSPDSVAACFGSMQMVPNILVHNAGFLAAPANFVEADLEEYWRSFTVNMYGTDLVTQSFLKHRRNRVIGNAPPAVVVTLNTIGAYSIRVPMLSSYGASKAALARWSELHLYRCL